MSSPKHSPKRTPKRTMSRRNPLQERSPSQKNEAAGRLKRSSLTVPTDTDIFTTTPFPIRPQHVLLPSTIRKQRSSQNVENELPDFFSNESKANVGSFNARAQSRRNERKVRQAPKLQLKRSVTVLRDMYEAQAENSRPSTAAYSRPSTAASSPALRPTSSKTLRSLSSSDGLSGRGAWEMLGLPKVSEDDLETLPTLFEDLVHRLEFEPSVAPCTQHRRGRSSSTFRTFEHSSPCLSTYHEFATSPSPISVRQVQFVRRSRPNVIQLGPSWSGASAKIRTRSGESSPNFVQLQESSSIVGSDPTPTSMGYEGVSNPNTMQFPHSSSMVDINLTALSQIECESSPNIVKLGTSSPERTTSPTPSQASTISRKRKRSHIEGSINAGRTPLCFRARKQRAPSSAGSPPARIDPVCSGNFFQSGGQTVLPSSPPELGSAVSQAQPTSSPVVRLHQGSFSADQSSLASAHTNLQSVLTSSPVALPQRPIVRTPNVNQFENLSLHKRIAPAPLPGHAQPKIEISSIPSVTNVEIQQISSTDISALQPRRISSRISVFAEELDDNLDTESIAPVQKYMQRYDLNSSQMHIVSDADQHEATDYLAALPRQHSSFAAALSQARSYPTSESSSRLNSTRTSLEDRMQSMHSSVYGRNESFRTTRPGSSGSYFDSSVVPTWARQYYSGFYRNSLHYLYQSQTNLDCPVIVIPPRTMPRPLSFPSVIRSSSSYETINSTYEPRRSWSRSARSSIKNFLQPAIQPIVRPRLNVTQSQITTGVSPLVSNPTRPSSEIISRPQSALQQRCTIRRVSAPILATDPRFHWNGIIEEPETAEEAEELDDHEYTGTPRYSTSSSAVPQRHRASTNRLPPPLRLLRLPTPHLHQDKRLNTGSEISQGFGAPYNARPQWQPTSGLTDQVGPPAWFKVDIRDMQVICFMAGFLCPPAWFVGAFTLLPRRPLSYHDLEKQTAYYQQSQYGTVEQGDILAQPTLEKHIRGLEEVKWQNARWWRRMNRCMCCVGFVVLIVVIVLAIIGTRSHWS